MRPEVVGVTEEARQSSRMANELSFPRERSPLGGQPVTPAAICTFHGVELSMTLAGVPNHCRRCERESAHEILTVERGRIQSLRDELETREIVRAE